MWWHGNTAGHAYHLSGFISPCSHISDARSPFCAVSAVTSSARLRYLAPRCVSVCTRSLQRQPCQRNRLAHALVRAHKASILAKQLDVRIVHGAVASAGTGKHGVRVPQHVKELKLTPQHAVGRGTHLASTPAAASKARTRSFTTAQSAAAWNPAQPTDGPCVRRPCVRRPCVRRAPAGAASVGRAPCSSRCAVAACTTRWWTSHQQAPHTAAGCRRPRCRQTQPRLVPRTRTCRSQQPGCAPGTKERPGHRVITAHTGVRRVVRTPNRSIVARERQLTRAACNTSATSRGSCGRGRQYDDAAVSLAGKGCVGKAAASDGGAAHSGTHAHLCWCVGEVGKLFRLLVVQIIRWGLGRDADGANDAIDAMIGKSATRHSPGTQGRKATALTSA